MALDSHKGCLNIRKLRLKISNEILARGLIVFVLIFGLVVHTMLAQPGLVTPVKALGSENTVTVTPHNKSKTYGDVFSDFTGNITGINNGDNITVSYASAGAAGHGLIKSRYGKSR